MWAYGRRLRSIGLLFVCAHAHSHDTKQAQLLLCDLAAQKIFTARYFFFSLLFLRLDGYSRYWIALCLFFLVLGRFDFPSLIIRLWQIPFLVSFSFLVILFFSICRWLICRRTFYDPTSVAISVQELQIIVEPHNLSQLVDYLSITIREQGFKSTQFTQQLTIVDDYCWLCACACGSTYAQTQRISAIALSTINFSITTAFISSSVVCLVFRFAVFFFQFVCVRAFFSACDNLLSLTCQWVHFIIFVRALDSEKIGSNKNVIERYLFFGQLIRTQYTLEWVPSFCLIIECINENTTA